MEGGSGSEKEEVEVGVGGVATSSTPLLSLPAISNEQQQNNFLFRDLFDLSTVTFSKPKKGKTVTKLKPNFELQRRPVFKGTHVVVEEEVIENYKEFEESIHKNNKELNINLFKGCRPIDRFMDKLALIPLHRVSREPEVKHGGLNTELKETYEQ